MFVKQYEEYGTTTVTIFATQRMKNHYLLYGDVVDIYYQFTPLKRARSGNHYNSCLFLGQAKNLKPIVFGIGLLNGECPLYYKLSIEYFLEAMSKTVPKTVITN